LSWNPKMIQIIKLISSEFNALHGQNQNMRQT
jgi:hypothetical protein